MENLPPSSSSADDDKGSYRSFMETGRQSLEKTYFESKQPKSFWSVLARKAKSVLLDDDLSMCKSEVGQRNNFERLQPQHSSARLPAEIKQQRGETPMLQRRLVALTSSLSSLGGTIGNAIEESLNKMEAKASDLISSKKLSDNAKTNHPPDHATNLCNEHSQGSSPFVRKGSFARPLCPGQPFVEPPRHECDQISLANSLQHDIFVSRSSQQYSSKAKPLNREDSVLRPLQQQSDNLAADKETQLKASRDVAMAMAAKAKLLLRELKEAKADLALARERCAQLEEENQIIRASIDSGLKPDEEDLVRIQLETLLAEKARLAQENAYFARENQFLREMIEYHRLTMQSEGTLLEESGMEATENASECNFNIDELPPETIISTIIS